MAIEISSVLDLSGSMIGIPQVCLYKVKSKISNLIIISIVSSKRHKLNVACAS